MNQVTVKYTQFEPKKHSIRMKTEERMGGQYPLPDMYVPRTILKRLGHSDDEMESMDFAVNITFSTNGQ